MKKRPEKKKFDWHLPNNLRELRNKHNITLDDLAYSTGLSKALLSQIENGKTCSPSVQTASLICGEFGIDIRAMCFSELPLL